MKFLILIKPLKGTIKCSPVKEVFVLQIHSNEQENTKFFTPVLFNSHPPMVIFYWVWNWEEVLFNVFSPTKKLHQRNCFTFRTICWKISRFLLYFSWLQYKQFVLISVQQNMQQKNIIPGKTKKEHQIGILLLWLFWLRRGWSGQLFPIWFCVQERNSQLLQLKQLKGKLLVCLLGRIFRITSEGSRQQLSWCIFLFHWTASRLKNSTGIQFSGFNKLLLSKIYSCRHLIKGTWNFYQSKKNQLRFPLYRNVIF